MGVRKLLERKISLQFSLASAFVGIVIITSALLGVSTYFNVRAFVRQGIRERLADDISVASLSINVNAHKTLKEQKDEESKEYKDIVQYLRNVRDRAKDIRFVYTIRKNEKGQIYFVTDAEETEENKSHLGDLYGQPSAPMLKSFERPYVVHVEKKFYTDQWGTFLSSYAPVLDSNGELEAIMGMDISVNKVLAYERRYLVIILSLSCFICLGVLIFGYLLSKRISKPLLLLEADMSRIQQFDLDSQIEVVSHVAEIIKMKQAVDNMKTGLRSFRKYVPAELVAELIRLKKEAVLGAEKRELTIFFSDITDFTSTSERFSPEQLSEKFAVYLKGMTQVILDQRGTVDKFIGDSVMAFWGAPTSDPDHAVMACEAALNCQRFIDHLAHEYDNTWQNCFLTRIGLHTGEALVGNMGFEERLSYTAIGDSVNIASRLEGLNKYYGTRILISEDTYTAAKDHIVVRFIDLVAVKGKKQAIAVYELMATRSSAVDPDMDQLALIHNKGMNFYFERKWEDAIEAFTEIIIRKPGDKPAQILVDRCRSLLDDPPSDAWDGVILMQEK